MPDILSVSSLVNQCEALETQIGIQDSTHCRAWGGYQFHKQFSRAIGVEWIQVCLPASRQAARRVRCCPRIAPVARLADYGLVTYEYVYSP